MELKRICLDDLIKVNCNEYVKIRCLTESNCDEDFIKEMQQRFEELAKGEDYVYFCEEYSYFFSQNCLDKHKIKGYKDKEYIYIPIPI